MDRSNKDAKSNFVDSNSAYQFWFLSTPSLKKERSNDSITKYLYIFEGPICNFEKTLVMNDTSDRELNGSTLALTLTLTLTLAAGHQQKIFGYKVPPALNIHLDWRFTALDV